MTFRVVVSDQVFPSVELERAMLREHRREPRRRRRHGRTGCSRSRPTRTRSSTRTCPSTPRPLGRLSRCRIVARYGIGVDNIDVGAARAAGIEVTNVPDYCVEEVAAHALGARPRARPTDPRRATRRSAPGAGASTGLRPIRRISELTVRAHRLRAHRAPRGRPRPGPRRERRRPRPVRRAAGRVRPTLVGLDELLEASDVVSVHAPATPETRGLIDAERIARMRPRRLPRQHLARPARRPRRGHRRPARRPPRRGRPRRVRGRAAADPGRSTTFPASSPRRTWPSTRRRRLRSPSERPPRR